MSNLSLPSILLTGPTKIGKSSEAVKALGKKAYWICLDPHALAPATNRVINPTGEVPDHYICSNLEHPCREVLEVIHKRVIPGVNAKKYLGVVVDPLTLLADREYRRVVARNEVKDGYGRRERLVGARIQEIIDTLTSLNAVVIAIAHERKPVNIEGYAKRGGPRLPGFLSEIAPSMFGMTLRCALGADAMGKGKAVFKCDGRDGNWYNGDSYGVVEDGMDMDLRKVLRRVYMQVVEGQDWRVVERGAK